MNAHLPARDHHVAGQAPDWSKPAQGFRHFDGTLADWRTTQPAHRAQRPRFSHRLRAGLANVISADPRERRDIGVFAVGMAWGVMCAIGMLAAWGIHP